MNASPLINNFSAGEFGPLASARVDLERYKSSQEICKNFIPRVQGGLTRRDGTRYVANTKTTGTTRLQSFIFSNEQAYILEFSENYIRIFTNGAQITISGNPIEIPTPYAAADLFALSFCQSNDILYIFHKNYTPAKLIRNSNTSWSLNGFSLLDGPYLGYIISDSDSTLRRDLYELFPSSATGNITLSFGSFASGSGIANVSNSGVYNQILITTSPTAFKASALKTGDRVCIQNILGTTEANGVWTIQYVTSTSFILVGSVFTNAYISSPSALATISLFTANDLGRNIRLLEGTTWGWGILRGLFDSTGTKIYCDVNSTLTNTSAKRTYQLGTFYITNNPSCGTFHEDRLWLGGPYQNLAASKVGDYENFAASDLSGVVTDASALSFNLSSNTVANTKWIVSDEKGILVGTSSDEWLIKSASIQTPITPTSISAKKTTSFGSQSIQPVQAGKAVMFAQASTKKIREFNYFYDVDGFRCQDVTQLAHHITGEGVTQLCIQKQPEQIVWATRKDGVIIGMTYERDADGLRVAWHQHPIAGFFNTSSNNAYVESIASIPTSDNSYDELWMVVKRYINGSYKKYIEYIGKPFDELTDQSDSYFVDSGLTYENKKTITNITNTTQITVTAALHGFSNGDQILFKNIVGTIELNNNVYKISDVATNTFKVIDFDGNYVNGSTFGAYISGGEVYKMVSTISGLTHLEGQTVSIIVDGANSEPKVVSSGSITLQDKAAKVSIGLGYNSDLKLPRIEAGSAEGTALGKTRRIHKLSIMLHKTLGLKFGESFDDLTPFVFQSGEDQLNQASPLFTGILSEEFSATYDTENKLCFRQDTPLPCTILAILPQLVEQDG